MPPSRPRTPASPDRDAMLTEHVRFELARWQGENLPTSVQEESDALFAWLETVSVGDLLPAAETAAAVAAIVEQVPAGDEMVAFVVEALLAARASLRASDAVVFDAVAAGDLHALVDLLSGMDELRGRVLGAVTDNPAYHEFVAHVLYHGVKAFVLSENVFARRVPGAQSLIKLGQRGLNTAAPGLEANVDRQLRRFVQGQIGDTLSDSKRYLDQTLTGESAHELLDTILGDLGPRRLGELAAALDAEDLAALTEQAAPIVRRALRTGLVGSLLAPAIERVLTAYADCDAAAVLADLGVDRETFPGQLTSVLRPAVEHAHATGLLEERLRARLAAFYLAG